MKVLSLLQPWASLVVTPHPDNKNSGIKEWETRCWRPRNLELIEQLKTEGFLIHASLGWKIKQADLLGYWPFDQYEYDFSMDFGMIIGHVKLVKIEPTGSGSLFKNNISDEEALFGDYSTGRFAWQLTQPLLFKKPIPAKGALNFWNSNDPIPELIK